MSWTSPESPPSSNARRPRRNRRSCRRSSENWTIRRSFPTRSAHTTRRAREKRIARARESPKRAWGKRAASRTAPRIEAACLAWARRRATPCPRRLRRRARPPLSQPGTTPESGLPQELRSPRPPPLALPARQRPRPQRGSSLEYSCSSWRCSPSARSPARSSGSGTTSRRSRASPACLPTSPTRWSRRRLRRRRTTGTPPDAR